MLDVPYGVFGAADLPGIKSSGSIGTDDEDDGNANSLGGVLTGVNTYVNTAGHNTVLKVAKVQ